MHRSSRQTVRAVRPVRRVRALRALALALLLAGLAAVTGVGTGGAAPATAYPGGPWIAPDQVYTGDFPDPEVVRVPGGYVAYATDSGGSFLPVLTSTDLVTWRGRSAYDPGGGLAQQYPGFNDGLPHAPGWAARFLPPRLDTNVWAPGVAQIGGRWVAYYAATKVASPTLMCLSVATADSPLGPFTDRTAQPLLCEGDSPGVLDPRPYVDPATGVPYLVWAGEGPGGDPPTKVWSRQLAPDGLSFAPGSSEHELVRESLAWEHPMVENPAMFAYQGKTYLLYSANSWWTDRYAIGWAVCDGPLGPCRKPSSTPLKASDGTRQGPGGPSPFVDAQGRLRMAYHYWTAPYVGYPPYPQCQSEGTCQSQGQRRMGITELRLSASGLLEEGVAPQPRPEAVAISTAQACPPSVPEDGFADVPEGSTHEAAVDCAAWWQVALGSGGRFSPGAPVTREQMASFLARVVRGSGGTLPAGGDAFSDDDGSVHEADVDALAAAGVVRGTAPGRFDPRGLVTRDQMATFLVRTAAWRTGRTLPSGTDWFWDDETSAHQADVNAAAAAGLATGTGGGAYSPAATVRRDQMATFVTRLLEVVVEAGGRRTG